jgi:hypothetical protein
MIYLETITKWQSELGARRAPCASWHIPAIPNLSQLRDSNAAGPPQIPLLLVAA